MKFLIISTNYKAGGAELQALFERKILTDYGHEVLYLTFDSTLKSGESLESQHLNLIGNYSLGNCRLERAIIDPYIIYKVKKIIKSERPDVVHYHNVSYAFNSIAIATKDIPTIQTIHDYSYLCDKPMKCVRKDYSVCNSCDKKNCRMYCFNNGFRDWFLLNYKYYVRSFSKHIRRKFIKNIISPSECLTKYLNKNGYKAITVNNPISQSAFNGFKKNLSERNYKKILFIGSISYRKGIKQFLDAYLSKEFTNIELEIVGSIGEGITEDCFNKLINKSGAKYLGAMEYPEVVKHLEEIYAIVIPSLWMENYPNVALEGMLTDCVVFGSNRGGMTEMVVDSRLLFDILNPLDIRRCLEIIDTMDESFRNEIIRKQKEYFITHNTEDMYYNNIMSLVMS